MVDHIPLLGVIWRLTLTDRGFSQAFYREKVHEKHFGFKDLESFMVGFWEAWSTSKGTRKFNMIHPL